MFDVTDFVDYVVDGDLKKGNSVILDDAGVFMNARDWQTVRNKAVSIVAQSFRYRNLITFITVPKWNYIDAQTRGLINIFFEATKEQGVFKVKLPEPNPFRKGEDFLVYPRVQVPNLGYRARTITVKTVKFSLPPQWLIDSYEQKRDGEIRKKQKDVQRMLHTVSSKQKEEVKPKRKINPNSIKNLKHVNDRKIIDSNLERKRVISEKSLENL